MRKNINVNVIAKTITISKSFYNKASKFGTAEYKELREVLTDCPTFEIVFSKSEKKTYHGLTVKKMEEYIVMQSNAEELLKTFENVKKVAKAKGSLYPITKKWFLETFEDYKENEATTNELEAVA